MITTIVLAKNEERNIQKCLESLAWCKKVLVVDDQSTDKTASIAKGLGAQVICHSSNGDFSYQRNWALKQTNTPWVFFVDADEVISPELANEIQSVANKETDNVGFFIYRHDFMWNKRLKYGDLWGMKILRLAKKGAGQWKNKIHELWVVKGNIGDLKNPILHYPHPTLVDFLRDINTYSTFRAQELYINNNFTNVFELISYPIFKFLLLYFLKLGILDGTSGFVHAMVMAFYSFLVRGKLWLLYKGIPHGRNKTN